MNQLTQQPEVGHYTDRELDARNRAFLATPFATARQGLAWNHAWDEARKFYLSDSGLVDEPGLTDVEEPSPSYAQRMLNLSLRVAATSELLTEITKVTQSASVTARTHHVRRTLVDLQDLLDRELGKALRTEKSGISEQAQAPDGVGDSFGDEDGPDDGSF